MRRLKHRSIEMRTALRSATQSLLIYALIIAMAWPSSWLLDSVAAPTPAYAAAARPTKKPNPQVATKKGAAAKPAANANAKTSSKMPPKPPVAPVSSAAKPTKKTFLKVIANVATASISIDGIIAGQANNLINTEPGLVEIEVTAAGYLPKRLKINITKDRENSVQVNLLKPQPKPKPQPKAPQPKTQLPVASKAPTKGQQGQPGGAKKAGLSSPKPSLQKGMSTASLTDQAPAKKKPKDLFAPTPSSDVIGGKSNGKSSSGADLASEFEMDAATGGAPAYGSGAPSYPAPGGYPNTGYQNTSYPGQAPTYYTPPPAYYAPPQTYYAPPPAYYAAPQAPSYAPPPPPPTSGYDPIGAAPAASGGATLDLPDPAGSASGPTDPASSGKASKGKSSGKNFLITLLPFGAGQFQNKSYLFGILFAASEAGALYYYKTNSDEAAAASASTNAYTLSKKDTSMTDAERQELNTFVAQRRQYVQDKQNAANMGIGAFVGLWVVGVAEAILNEPPPKSAKKSPRAKRRKFSGFSLEEFRDNYELGFNLGLPMMALSTYPAATQTGQQSIVSPGNAGMMALETASQVPGLSLAPSDAPQVSLGIKVSF